MRPKPASVEANEAARDFVRLTLRDKGMSTKTFAVERGVSHSTLKHWMAGEVEASLTWLELILNDAPACQELPW